MDSQHKYSLHHHWGIKSYDNLVPIPLINLLRYHLLLSQGRAQNTFLSIIPIDSFLLLNFHNSVFSVRYLDSPEVFPSEISRALMEEKFPQEYNTYISTSVQF